MRYRVTCLTPTLVGDGRKLSPIDYMVWKDRVSVLDQNRIFKLLAKGPRLEGYLTQLKKASKLDFASWGGFAQNYADRRIPFESAADSGFWSRAPIESLSIPTFASGTEGPFLPGTAIKGALRTGMLFANAAEGTLKDLAERFGGERPPRRPAEAVEENLLGGGGAARTRFLSAADSDSVPESNFKVYLVRVATLQTRAPGAYTLAWKQAGRGNVMRPEESTPAFAEMAAPGTVFEGGWQENRFFDRPEIRRALHWANPVTRERIFSEANQYAAKQLEVHKQYAAWTGLDVLGKQIEELEGRVAGARERGRCVVSIGWGAGFIGKSAWLDTNDPDYRRILRIPSGLPFPKTRRIVFLNSQPATLPGWVELEVV
ncbi:MAG: type III-A CRISPR-associated RAMP protein Csm5 [Bryobacteraceae bacterium]